MISDDTFRRIVCMCCDLSVTVCLSCLYTLIWQKIKINFSFRRYSCGIGNTCQGQDRACITHKYRSGGSAATFRCRPIPGLSADIAQYKHSCPDYETQAGCRCHPFHPRCSSRSLCLSIHIYDICLFVQCLFTLKFIMFCFFNQILTDPGNAIIYLLSFHNVTPFSSKAAFKFLRSFNIRCAICAGVVPHFSANSCRASPNQYLRTKSI